MSDAFKTIHIKGPWEADEGPFGEYAEVYGPDGDRVAQVEDNLALEESANQRARLISQAPQMQETLIQQQDRIEALEEALEYAMSALEKHGLQYEADQTANMINRQRAGGDDA